MVSCRIQSWNGFEVTDCAHELAEQIRAAEASGRPLRIRGGDTRSFLRGDVNDDTEVLDVRPHRGIVAFEPAELVITARGGTPLEEIESTLAEARQCLPFDPPRFAAGSTLGGAVASGLAGPARPWQGSVRDAVLGITLLDGRAGSGRFGGQVMKNVAGYDVARLNAGAMGALGVLLQISLRVAPVPEQRATRVLEAGLAQAREQMTALARRPLPITGLAWEDGRLRVRLAGSEAGVAAAVAAIGGDACEENDRYWDDLRDSRLAFFAGDGPLWRLSLPVTAPQPDLAANWLLDWGGAQRWCRTDAPPETVFAAATALGGHAMRQRPAPARSPLPAAMARLQARIKAVFDPAGILNPGVLYPDSL